MEITMLVFLGQFRARAGGFWRRLATQEGALVAALLLVAAAIRLPLMTYTGYYQDLATYISWGTSLVTHGFSTLYTATTSVTGGGFGGQPGGGFGGGFPGGRGFGGGFGGFGASQGVNYPPGTPYLFGLMVALWNGLVAPFTHTTLAQAVSQQGWGPLFAKLPLLAADLAATALLYWETRKRHGRWVALLAAASWAFSPALLYNGALWGQTDGLVALPVLAALFALLAERYATAGACLALAALIKPQPVIFIPLVLLYLWRWAPRQGARRFTAALCVTALVALLPVMIPTFQLGDMLHNMQAQSYSDNVSLTSDAFNLWWLIGYNSQNLGALWLGIKASLWGDALFGLVTLFCAVQIWRHREPVYLCFGLALEMFGFFAFMGGQHERYLFLFAPLALASLIVVERPSDHLYALYFGGGALCLLNMLVGVGGGAFRGGDMLPFLPNSALASYVSTNFSALGQALAALTMGCLAWAL